MQLVRSTFTTFKVHHNNSKKFNVCLLGPILTVAKHGELQVCCLLLQYKEYQVMNELGVLKHIFSEYRISIPNLHSCKTHLISLI